MHYSLCLLTVTWLAAAPADAPPQTNDQTAAPAVTDPAAQPPVPDKSAAVPLSFRERMRKLFGAKPKDPPATQDPTAMTLAQPAPTTLPSTRPALPPMSAAPMPAAGMPMPSGVQLSAKDLEKCGHEQDYSWITGKLVQQAGNHWMIRYAGPYEVDQFGGALVLASLPEMSTYREGDIVCLHGKVLGGSHGSGHATGVYQVSSINLIEHAGP